MHSLVHCQSKDTSNSSKCSRNVVDSSPSDRTGKIEGGQCNASRREANMPAPPPNRQLHIPQDIYPNFDTSDSEDCESVGSNSPVFEGAHGTLINHQSAKIEKNITKSPIPGNNRSVRETSKKMNGGSESICKMITNKSLDGRNRGPNSSTLVSKNKSSNVIPPKTTHGNSNSTSGLRSEKHPQRQEVDNGRIQDTLDSISKKGYTKNSSSRHGPRESSTLQASKAKKSTKESIVRSDDSINFDEGDGRRPLNTTDQLHTSEQKNNNSHLSQNQNEEDLEFLDEGDGGGTYSSSYMGTPRKRHGRRLKYGTRSNRGSGRSSTGSRASSRMPRSRGSQQSSSHSRRSGRRKHRTSRQGSPSRRGSRSSSCYSNVSWMEDYGLSALRGTKPYPAKWRCFGKRPPAIHEFRPMGEGRVKNVRPAGKPGYLVRNADTKHGCQVPAASDPWDSCYGLAKPITDQWSTPLPYGTKVIRVGDIDPYFQPSRGDVVIINPAQNFYRAMKSGYVITYNGHDYSFGVGDLIVRLGRFMPNGEYIPYGNLELYMHTQTRDMRLLGRQPFLLVDSNYHNLDYESPGKHLAIGTFLNDSFFPRRGDIIICGGAWAENYPNIQRKHHSSVKYWRPKMEFLPNDMLVRPYVDIGRKSGRSGRDFYWGAAELYSYSGKGLAWAYWGRDHHICDTPYPREQEHGIKSGHHKDEVGHYGDGIPPSYGGPGYRHGHKLNDGHHAKQDHFTQYSRSQNHSHGHHKSNNCYKKHGQTRHPSQ